MIPVTFNGCFGWLHPGCASRGVVLCSPHGHEEICVHRVWRSFAEALAEAGMPTLRFDYRGTGDSEGDDDGDDRVLDWIISIVDAVQWLRKECNITEVALVGLRVGAVLLLHAAEILDSVDAVVLLAPPTSGEIYVRELYITARLQLAQVRLNNCGGTELPVIDGIDVGGFVYTTQTLQCLRKLGVPENSSFIARRSLILARRDLAADRSFINKLCELCGNTIECSFEGYADLMQLPVDVCYPQADFDRVKSWLMADMPEAKRPKGNFTSTELVLASSRESYVRFGELHSLFGVASVPTNPNSVLPAVLFMSSGPSCYHIGQGRLWVSLARELSRHGVTSLRFDVGGAGDSLDRPTETRQSLLCDVNAAVDWLMERGHNSVVLIGHCAGAHLGFRVSIQDVRVSGQVMINPQSITPDGKAAGDIGLPVSYYLRMALKYSKWRRVFQGHVDTQHLVRVLVSRCFYRIVGILSKKLKHVAGIIVPLNSMDNIQKTTSTMLVFNFGNPGLTAFSRAQQRVTLDHLEPLQVEILYGADHCLWQRTARQSFLEMVIGYLQTVPDKRQNAHSANRMAGCSREH